MDDFNHIMDPEYANIVYQTQSEGENILLANNNHPNISTNDLQQQQLPLQQQLQQPAYATLSTVPVASFDETIQLQQPQSIDMPSISNDGFIGETINEGASMEPQILENKSDQQQQQQQETETNAETLDNVDAQSQSVNENIEHPSDQDQTEVAAVDNEAEAEAAVKSVEQIDNAHVPNQTESGDEPKAEKTAAEEQNPVIEKTDADVDESDKEIVPDVDVKPIIKTEVEEIDKQQCRVCLSTENLEDIFKYDDKNSLRVCDLLMKLCSAVRISERDYLPHLICTPCIERVNMAYELKLQCEETEKLLRSKLKRSKKTTRGPSEFVMIDCAEFSSDSDDDKNKDDDEFHLSEVTEASDPDSDMSYSEKKKRIQPRRNRRRASKPTSTKKRKSSVTLPTPSAKKIQKGVVYIEAPESDDDLPISKRRNRKSRNNKSYESDEDTPIVKKAKSAQHACNLCEKICLSAEGLRQHKRIHIDEKCPICQQTFTQRASLAIHIQKHKENAERTCGKCGVLFVSKFECKKHLQTAHQETFTCDKCKRQFTAKSRFDKHKCAEVTIPTRKYETDFVPSTPTTGRDLFKSVAPLTTTYWSDSYSD